MQHFVVLLILIPVTLFGQSTDSLKNLAAEPQYIAPIEELLTLKVAMHNDRNGFATYNNGQLLDIRPNATTYLKLGASYRFVSMSYAFATNFLPGNGDEDLKGKSRTNSY